MHNETNYGESEQSVSSSNPLPAFVLFNKMRKPIKEFDTYLNRIFTVCWKMNTYQSIRGLRSLKGMPLSKYCV